jgi:hypothetical protein
MIIVSRLLVFEIGGGAYNEESLPSGLPISGSPRCFVKSLPWRPVMISGLIQLE